MWGAQVPLSSIWAVAALSCPLPGTAACPQCSGVAAVPLATLQCFVSLLGREELGTVWAAPPESPACLGRIQGRGWGRDRAATAPGPFPAAEGESRERSGQDPQLRPVPLCCCRSFASLSQLIALRRPQTANLCPAAAGESGDKIGPCLRPGTGRCGRDGERGRAVRGTRAPGSRHCPSLPFPRRRLWRCGRRAGGGGVRRAAGRADADSERTFCSRKSR